MASGELHKDVFLTCRTILVGQNAQVRRPKKIREVLQQNRSKTGPLISQNGLDRVVDAARQLLERGVFGSNLKAKIEFPELYQSSPGRGAQRTAVEVEAARSEAEAFAEAGPSRADCVVDAVLVRELSEYGEYTILSTGNSKLIGPSHTEEQAILSSQSQERSHTLFPVYMSYRSQHRILNSVQSILEDACFDFGKRWLPDLLTANNWRSPEAVELIKWTKILAQHRKTLPLEAFNENGGKITDAQIFHTNHLRHAAVHRLPTTITGTLALLTSAEKLVVALDDTVRAAKVQRLICELESVGKDMEGNKVLLESRLDKEMADIEQQRRELDKREQDAIAAMLADDAEYQSLLSSLLEQSAIDILGENASTTSKDENLPIATFSGQSHGSGEIDAILDEDPQDDALFDSEQGDQDETAMADMSS